MYIKKRLLRILLSFIIIVYLSSVLLGCSNNRILFQDQYIFSQDSQYSFLGKDFLGGIAKTETGYYFLSGPHRQFLFYYDKRKEQAIPVCYKPNCLHTDEPDGSKIAECNAFLGVEISFLNYYMNSLYYVTLDSSANGLRSSLYEISLDGSKRKKIVSFTDTIFSLQIHRGYIYYATTDSGTIGGQETKTKTKFKVCRISITNTNMKPEIVDQGTEIYGQIGTILCYRDSVYYSVRYFTDASLTKDESYINMFDIRTKKISRILDGTSAFFNIFDNRLIYAVAGQGTFTRDLNGSNAQKLCDEFGFYTANSKFLFIDTYFNKFTNNNRSLEIYDQKLSKVKTILLSEYEMEPLGCDEDYYFISSNKKSNEIGRIEQLDCIRINEILNNMGPREFHSFIPSVPFSGITTNIND